MSEVTTQELATTQGVPPAIINTGLGDFGTAKIANLVLVQNTTRDPMGASPGQYLDTLGGEVLVNPEMIPLRVSRARVMFPPGENNLDADPLCRSSDGFVPSPFALVPQARQCGFFEAGKFKPVCPNAKWTSNGAGKKATKPPCQEKVRLLLVDRNTGLPYWYSFGGMGIAAFQITLEKIQRNILKTKNTEGTVLEFYDYFFKLGSDRQTGSKGAYYIPRFDITRVATPGQYAELFAKFAVRPPEDDEVQDEAVNTSVNNLANGVADGVVHEAELVSEV